MEQVINRGCYAELTFTALSILSMRHLCCVAVKIVVEAINLHISASNKIRIAPKLGVGC